MLFIFGNSEPTEEEKQQAVKTLRDRLSDGSQPVLEQLQKGGEAGSTGLDDHMMNRWLRAENYSVDKAEARLREHATWREAEFPAGQVLESEIEEELAVNKIFLQGNDKLGRPILVLQVSKHSVSTRKLDQTMRTLCYSLDKAIALADAEKNPEGKIVGIFDLRGLTMDCIDYHALKGVFSMLQNHYPERLGTLWMYESPGIFWALWKAVSPFIDPVTKKKVIFISESKGAAEMEAEIDLQVLPTDFGGGATLVPIKEVPTPAGVPAASNGVQNGTAQIGAVASA